MQEWVTVKEAAEILGITQDGVRKRIARKLMSATKQDDKWRVLVEKDTTTPDTPPRAAEEPKTPAGTVEPTVLEIMRDQIRQLEEQNRQLWGQLERITATADQQARTLDHFLALTAGTVTTGDQATEETPKPPATFWQRVFGGRR